jgi:2-succinyl-6-hydroxy-2,4-cyclohexadiene-1-carboxylate synthase
MFTDVASQVDARIMAPNLPGHGGRDAGQTGWTEAVDEVAATAREVSPRVIVGYSMGGRLALSAALAAPGLAPSLILVSTSLGIESDPERAARRAADEATAMNLQNGGSVEDFLTSFHRSPIVSAPRATIDLESIRRATTREGLIGALRGMGQGSQPYVGDRLNELQGKVTWMVGAEDHKYAAIARQAHARCRHGSLVIVPDSGHNVVAERPDAVAAAIRSALEG